MKVVCRDVAVEYACGGQAVRPIDGLDLEVSSGRLVVVAPPRIAVAAGVCAGALATRRGLHADPSLTSGAAR
jgi:hypothetical protein